MIIVETTSPQSDPRTPGAVMLRVTAIADGPLAEAAFRIDHERLYPLEIMASLAQAGAFGAHLDRNGGNFGLAIDAMRAVSRRLWRHRFSVLVP